MKHPRRDLVYNICGRQHNFSPKGFWNMMMMKESSGDIKKLLHFSFSDSILLRSINTRGFMNSALLLEVMMQVIIEIIPCIISPKLPDKSAKLSVNHFAKRG